MDFHSKLVDAKFQLGVHFNLRDKQTETLKYLFHGRDCIGRSYFVPRARNGNFRGETNVPR